MAPVRPPRRLLRRPRAVPTTLPRLVYLRLVQRQSAASAFTRPANNWQHWVLDWLPNCTFSNEFAMSTHTLRSGQVTVAFDDTKQNKARLTRSKIAATDFEAICFREVLELV
ncbi:unnamed protein product [Amaranthus hypochondriacus]